TVAGLMSTATVSPPSSDHYYEDQFSRPVTGTDCWDMTELTSFKIPELRSLSGAMIVLLAIALLVISWALLKFIQALWTYFICYLLGFGAKWQPGPDSWAIITGSTDGIGLAYAKAMARKGYCLLLLSRNPQKLDK